MYVCMYLLQREGTSNVIPTRTEKSLATKPPFATTRTLFARSAGSKLKSESQRMECGGGVQLGTFPCDRSSTTFGIDSVSGRSGVTDV